MPTKKDAPLYDLDSTSSNETSSFPVTSTPNHSIDPLEQYLTPVLSQTSTIHSLSTKDDYLATLLTSDVHKSHELSILSNNKPQRSTDTNRISAIAHELLHSTANSTVLTPVSLSTTGNSHSNDDFLSLLENKEFLECLTESTTIDSILSQNSTNVIEPLFPSMINKHSEQDEQAISEIYRTLVTSFHPGKSTSLSVDQTLHYCASLIHQGPNQQSSSSSSSSSTAAAVATSTLSTHDSSSIDTNAFSNVLY
jgi:hypothetical protein